MITEEEVDRMFKMGFDCSQIVLSYFSDRLGITKEHALKISSCFGIGMAQGGVCGAATGAMMALGIRYGNSIEGDFQTKDALFKKRDEFMARFEEVNGARNCPELLGRRVDTLQDMMVLSGTGLFGDCRRYCVNAITILEDML